MPRRWHRSFNTMNSTMVTLVDHRWMRDLRFDISLEMDADLARPDFDGRWDKQTAKQEIDPLFNRSKHWKTKMDKVKQSIDIFSSLIEPLLTRKFSNVPYRNSEKTLFENKWWAPNVSKGLCHSKVIRWKSISKLVWASDRDADRPELSTARISMWTRLIVHEWLWPMLLWRSTRWN